MKEEEKEDSSQSKRSGPTLRISTDISPQPQTISSISSPSPSASSPNSPPSRQIAPLGSSRRPRSKTPTQREPNPNSPSFSNQSFNESSPNSFRRGRNRPKTWSGRSQHSIERRPIWNPSNLSPNRSSNTNSNSPISPKSFVRSLTLEESSDNSRSRDRDREIERGRSLSRSPIKPRGEEIDREALSSEEEETARQKIVLSNLAISIDNMDHQSSSILSNLHPNESASDRESSRNSSRGRGRGIGGSRLGPIPIPSHQEFHHSHQHQHDHSQHHDGYSHFHEHPPGSAHGNEGTVEDRVDSQDERDQEKERAHFLSVLEAFDQYLPYCLAANSSRRRSLYALPRAHQALLRDVGSTLPSPTLDPDSDSNSKSQQQQPQPPLRGVKSRLDEIDDRIRRNADVLNEIVKDSRGGFLGEEESATKSKSDEDSEVENISRGQEEVERGRSSFVDQAADSSPEEDHPSNLRQSRSKSRSSNSKGRDSSKGKAKQTSNEPEENSTTEASSSGLPSLPSTSNAEDKASPNFDNSKSERSARHEARKQARERLKKARAAEYGVDKIRSTLKQLVRDWSSFGSLERELAYGPIIQTIEERFGSIPENERNLVRILVPGAGLGRLAFELAWRGFSTQGNEFSFYMLLASHFVLNKTKKVDEHLIYPYIHSSSNWRNAQDMLQEVRFPDVKPSELPHQVDFSMVAGEFIEVYSSPTESQKWDVVATCFFIDTARNFIRYLEVFNHLLPLGGLWINLGPLLWHYEGGSGSGSDDNESKKKLLEDDISIELTLEEVLDCTRRMGFEIEEQRSLPEMPYTGNPSGMLCYQYKPEYWVARKVAHVQFAGDA